ncbi:MAG: iron-sulfur cluster assembly accessory protein [Pseudomonadota bacterium]
MAITLSPSAADRVRAHVSREGRFGIRLGVRKSGCTGYAYVLEYADAADQNDVVFDHDEDVRVVVDRDSLEFLDGTEVDFIKQGLNEMFTFRNPNVTSECGCGESVGFA